MRFSHTYDVTPEELLQVIESKPPNKSTGLDAISWEQLKKAPPEMITFLTEGCTQFFQTARLHEDMQLGIIKYILKNPNATQAERWLIAFYRPITLQSVITKLAVSIFIKRVNKYSNNGNTSVQQRGWKSHMGVAENLRIHVNVREYHNYFNLPLIMVFMDGKTAFPSANIMALGRIMKELSKPPQQTQDIVVALMNNLSVQINTCYGLTQKIKQERGLPQGSVEGGPCYAWLIDPAIRIIEKLNERHPNVGCGVTINELLIAIIAFADDLNPMARTTEGMQMALDELAEFYDWSQMKMNCSEDKLNKTVAIFYNMPSKDLYWNGEGKQQKVPVLPADKSYKYIGARMQPDGGWDMHAGALVSAIADLCKRIRTSHCVEYQATLLVTAHILSKASFAMEHAILTEQEANSIDVFSRQILKESFQIGGSRITNELIHLPNRCFGLGVERCRELQDRITVEHLVQHLNSTDEYVQRTSKEMFLVLMAEGNTEHDEGGGFGHALCVMQRHGMQVYNSDEREFPFTYRAPIGTLVDQTNGLDKQVARKLVLNGFLTTSGPKGITHNGLPKLPDELGLNQDDYANLCHTWFNGSQRRHAFGQAQRGKQVSILMTSNASESLALDSEFKKLATPQKCCTQEYDQPCTSSCHATTPTSHSSTGSYKQAPTTQ